MLVTEGVACSQGRQRNAKVSGNLSFFACRGFFSQHQYFQASFNDNRSRLVRTASWLRSRTHTGHNSLHIWWPCMCTISVYVEYDCICLNMSVYTRYLCILNYAVFASTNYSITSCMGIETLFELIDNNICIKRARIVWATLYHFCWYLPYRNDNHVTRQNYLVTTKWTL